MTRVSSSTLANSRHCPAWTTDPAAYESFLSRTRNVRTRKAGPRRTRLGYNTPRKQRDCLTLASPAPTAIPVRWHHVTPPKRVPRRHNRHTSPPAPRRPDTCQCPSKFRVLGHHHTRPPSRVPRRHSRPALPIVQHCQTTSSELPSRAPTQERPTMIDHAVSSQIIASAGHRSPHRNDCATPTDARITSSRQRTRPTTTVLPR